MMIRKTYFNQIWVALLAILLTTQTLQAQYGPWELVYDEIESLGNIKGIVFVPGDDYLWETGWAAQYNGTILKTTDGGDTWMDYSTGSSSVWGVDFVDEDTGYVCDQDGNILKTTDGGVTWSNVHANSAYAFNKIKFQDANNGVATGYPSNVYTDDGGTTWTDAAGGSDYWGLDHASGDTFYGVTSFTGEVGRTEDSGETWSTVHTTGFGVTVCVNFLDLDYGIVGGAEYKVKITSDGGNSWISKDVDNGSGDVLAAAWFDQDTVWVAGSGVYKSTDGGMIWTQDTTMTASGIANREMFVTGMNTIFVTGDNIGTSAVQIWRKIGPSPLQADFEADQTTVCVGSTVDFTDLSIGNIVTWDWTFEGGTPSSSSDQDPSVTYNSTGVFDVELTVYDNAIDDTKVIYDYITVLDTPDKAGTPEGDENACTGTMMIYTIDPVDFAQDYDWEINPANAGTLTWELNEATLEVANDWTGDFSVKVRATNICGDGDWSDELEGTVYESPEEFALEGGGGYCLGTDGAELTLNGSQTGVDYELYLDGDPTGNIVEGTGSEISFELVTSEGYYEAVASNDNCDLTMMNQVQVWIDFPPLEPETPTGPEVVCEEASTDYTSGGSDDADSYVWELSPVEAGSITFDGLEATVDWDTEFLGLAYVSLYGINECGDGNSSFELEISVGSPNPQVSGESLVCDFSDEIYEVAENEGSTYTWEVTGGEITEGQGTFMITVSWAGVGTGTVSVEEETEGGCSGSSEEFEVMIDDCTSIGENTLEEMVDLYPNPAKDFVSVRAEFEIDQVAVYSLRGELLLSIQPDSKDVRMGISRFGSGMYLVRIITDNGVVTKRLVID